MKIQSFRAVFTAFAIISTSAGFATAAIYNDAENDLFDNGLTNLDIESVEITNDSTWLYIKLSTFGDLDAANWGKYAIGIDNGVGSGDNSNGWGRSIDWDRTITHWSATWADDAGSGAGGEVYSYSGGWNLIGATYAGDPNIAASDAGHADGAQSWQLLLSDLGVSVGDTIEFDVITTANGGGDPGVDHLSRSDMATSDWSVASTAGDFLSYTIVPEPSAIACLVLAGLSFVTRQKRKS